MDNEKNTMQYDNDVKELIVARLETLPSGTVISIGSGQEFTKEEIIQSVRDRNDIGQKMVEIEMFFLQGLKDGILYNEILASN